MRAVLGLVLLATIFMLAGVSPGAAVTDAQARATCAKMADKNGISPTTRQRYIDTCVTKVTANQKK